MTRDPTPFDVLLSYDAHDSERVERLALALRSAGVRVWFDRWELVPGSDADAATERAQASAPVIALCFGERGVDPQRVAAVAGDHRIVALRLDGADAGALPRTVAAYDVPELLDDASLQHIVDALLPEREARAASERATSLLIEGDASATIEWRRRMLASLEQVPDADPHELAAELAHLGLALFEAGNLVEAEHVQRRALALLDTAEAERERLGVMNYLVATLLASGRAHDALTPARAVVEAYERLGNEQGLVTALNNLAQVCAASGDRAEAVRLQERALAVRRRISGDDDPRTIDAMLGLAAALRDARELRRAAELLETALEAQRRLVGPEDAQMLVTQSVLAAVLRDLRKLARARALLEEVVEIRRRLHGPDDNSVLVAMNNLAVVLRQMRRLDESEALLKEVVASRVERFGRDDPRTLIAMNNLGLTRRHKRDLSGARELHEHVFEVRRRTLGPDDPKTLSAASNLAIVLRRQHEYERAAELLEHVVEIRVERLGMRAAATLRAMSNLALAVRRLGDGRRARALLEDVVRVREKRLEPDHPDTLKAKNNLANTLRALDEPEAALALHEEVLAARKKTQPDDPDHPDTLQAMNNLGVTLAAAGRRDEAIAMLEYVVARRKALFGPDHEDTKRSQRRLAQVRAGEAGDDPSEDD